jgi:hypothetical protein
LQHLHLVIFVSFLTTGKKPRFPTTIIIIFVENVVR